MYLISVQFLDFLHNRIQYENQHNATGLFTKLYYQFLHTSVYNTHRYAQFLPFCIIASTTYSVKIAQRCILNLHKMLLLNIFDYCKLQHFTDNFFGNSLYL